MCITLLISNHLSENVNRICIKCTLTLIKGEELMQSLVANTSTFVKQDWTFCFNHQELHLMYKVVGLSHMVGTRSMAFHGVYEEVSKINWEVIGKLIKDQVANATCHLTKLLEKRFAMLELLCDLVICYPQHWLVDLCEASFPGHLETLKHHLKECMRRGLGQP